MICQDCHLTPQRKNTHLGLNKSPIVILTNTTRPPPPSPCIALAAINIPIVTEVAAIKDPAKKMRLAMRGTGFRPHMSEILPHIGVDAATASRYEEPIQVYPAEVWKYSAIVGKAVVTTVYKRSDEKSKKCRTNTHNIEGSKEYGHLKYVSILKG